MTVQIYRFDSPARFIVGTVGTPGDRTFFLQARDNNQLISVQVEKDQVSILADRVQAMLTEVLEHDQLDDVAADADSHADTEPLEQPIVQEFRVGAMTLMWEIATERVVIAAYAVSEGEEGEPPEDPEESDRDVLVVRMTDAAAYSFAKRAQAVVEAGRPPCPLCGLPLDADGHICPRRNGYRRH